jgi:hypothetical protein
MTKKQMVELCTDTLINAKIKNWKEVKKTELMGRSALWGLRAALGCSAIEEEGEEKGGGGRKRRGGRRRRRRRR